MGLSFNCLAILNLKSDGWFELVIELVEMHQPVMGNAHFDTAQCIASSCLLRATSAQVALSVNVMGASARLLKCLSNRRYIRPYGSIHNFHIEGTRNALLLH